MGDKINSFTLAAAAAAFFGCSSLPLSREYNFPFFFLHAAADMG